MSTVTTYPTPPGRHHRRSHWMLLGLGMGLVAAVLAGMPAAAASSPTYGHGLVSAYSGTLSTPGSTSTDEAQDSLPFDVEAGSPWWCPPGDPGCGITIPPGVGLGWGQSALDPALGVIRTRVGALNTATSVATWDNDPPFPPYTPLYFGQAESDTYLRSTWRIVSSDGSLQPGAAVEVSAAIALDGLFDNPPYTQVKAALLLHTQAAADRWLGSRDYLTMPNLIGLLEFDPPPNLLFYDSGSGAVAGAPNFVDSLNPSFAVGDVIVLETLLWTIAGAPNDGNPKEVWSDFYNTLQSSLAVTTPGAQLVAVPEPASWVMMAAGLAWVGGLARRRRALASATLRRP